MGLGDFDSMDFDADQARYDRMNRTQQSDFAPGQGDDLNSLYNNDISQSCNGNSLFETQFQTNTGGDLNATPQQQISQQPVKSDEDKLFDFVVLSGKAVINFLKDITGSFKEVTPMFWREWGYKTSIVCGVVFAGGIILRLLGLKFGMGLMRGALLGAIPSVCSWFFSIEESRKYTSMYKEDNENVEQESEPEPEQDENFEFEDQPFEDEFISDEDEDDFDFNDFEDFIESEEEEEFVKEDGMDLEEALDTMTVLDKGMYTRSYLYEMFTKVLPRLSSSFGRTTEYDAEDDTFLYWDEKLREAATVTGMKDEYLPCLQELSENLFTIKLVCDRPQGFKPDAVAQELSNIYAFQEGVSSIAYKVEPVGTFCYITLYTGKSEMISLRDMYKEKEDYILNTDNYLPVVIGVTTSGEVKVADFKKIESVIVTGMPRSGKSWFVQNILYQMCSFVAPSELNLYICDPKDGISDYKNFCLPHVRGFESDDEKVLKLLRHIVKVEAPKRKKIIGDAKFQNIWDFKNSYPDVKMPIIYVVIDEIVTFASRMDKETNQEFRMMLRELISQLPALGIRAFLIPHILNNDIIEKKTSDLVNCRISICGDADHIEKATGAKPKQFPHKLRNKGDMAVRMPDISEEVMFIHPPVLTTQNNTNMGVFDYARRVWEKLEPESVDGSVAEEFKVSKAQEELLSRMKVDDTMTGDDLIIW